MVFNVAEETARGDQQQQPTFAKGRQRKSSSSTGTRKSKVALSQTLPGAEAKFETAVHLEPTKPNFDGAGSQLSMSRNEMGIRNSTQSFHDESLNARGSNYIPGEPAKAINNSSICVDLHTSKGKSENNSLTPNVSNEDTAASQISKLKSLLLLQISLIGRQQDLLRLRDREIMQLKASNTNFKCQLNRVRRRISKRKDANDEPTSPKTSTKRKLVDNAADPFTPLNTTSSTLANEGESKLVLTQSFVGTTNCLDSKLLQTSSKFMMNQTTESTTQHSDKPTDSILQTSQDTNFVNKQNTDILLTPTNDKTAVPVPLAFVEQKQAELMEAMMISPPEKAIRTFCDITNTSPSLVEFPFKICNQCPHCVAIATEITRLFKNAEQFSSSDPAQATIDKARTEELLKLSTVSTPSADIKDYQRKDLTKCTSILRTSVSYFRFSPTFDSQHWWWDLKCGNIKTENPLKIPTWKENELLPLISTSDRDITEATDDQTFMKRHMKHELDEKRRKRWDIQRIREYRYNEKLRQKLVKQGAIYEAPFVETFSGHLHDAESVEVHEYLPVNVFGYPAPHLEPEEFSLPFMDDTKAFTSGVSRKKVKKF